MTTPRIRMALVTGLITGIIGITYASDDSLKVQNEEPVASKTSSQAIQQGVSIENKAQNPSIMNLKLSKNQSQWVTEIPPYFKDILSPDGLSELEKYITSSHCSKVDPTPLVIAEFQNTLKNLHENLKTSVEEEKISYLQGLCELEGLNSHKSHNAKL